MDARDFDLTRERVEQLVLHNRTVNTVGESILGRGTHIHIAASMYALHRRGWARRDIHTMHGILGLPNSCFTSLFTVHARLDIRVLLIRGGKPLPKSMLSHVIHVCNTVTAIEGHGNDHNTFEQNPPEQYTHYTSNISLHECHRRLASTVAVI